MNAEEGIVAAVRAAQEADVAIICTGINVLAQPHSNLLLRKLIDKSRAIGKVKVSTALAWIFQVVSHIYPSQCLGTLLHQLSFTLGMKVTRRGMELLILFSVM